MTFGHTELCQIADALDALSSADRHHWNESWCDVWCDECVRDVVKRLNVLGRWQQWHDGEILLPFGWLLRTEFGWQMSVAAAATQSDRRLPRTIVRNVPCPSCGARENERCIGVRGKVRVWAAERTRHREVAHA